MPGRGGAGNIIQAQAQSKKTSEDIEAAQPSSTTSTSASTSTPASPWTSQPYAHTGRGGAGNWYQPSTLSATGTFTTPSDATAPPRDEAKPAVSTPWHPEGQQMPVGRAGRGGAGNFVWADGEEQKRGEEEEVRRAEIVKEGVERDVEAGLARPGKVVLGGVKAGRGW